MITEAATFQVPSSMQSSLLLFLFGLEQVYIYQSFLMKMPQMINEASAFQ